MVVATVVWDYQSKSSGAILTLCVVNCNTFRAAQRALRTRPMRRQSRHSLKSSCGFSHPQTAHFPAAMRWRLFSACILHSRSRLRVFNRRGFGGLPLFSLRRPRVMNLSMRISALALRAIIALSLSLSLTSLCDSAARRLASWPQDVVVVLARSS